MPNLPESQLKRFITIDYIIKSLIIDRMEGDMRNYELYKHYAIRGARAMNLLGFIDTLKRVELHIEDDGTACLPEDFLQYLKVGVMCSDLDELEALGRNDNLMPPMEAPHSDKDCNCGCGCKSPLCNSFSFPQVTTEEVVLPTMINGNLNDFTLGYAWTFPFDFSFYVKNLVEFSVGTTIANQNDLDTFFVTTLGWIKINDTTYHTGFTTDTWGKFRINLPGPVEVILNITRISGCTTVDKSYTKTTKICTDGDNVMKETETPIVNNVPVIYTYLLDLTDQIAPTFTTAYFIVNGIHQNLPLDLLNNAGLVSALRILGWTLQSTNILTKQDSNTITILRLVSNSEAVTITISTIGSNCSTNVTTHKQRTSICKIKRKECGCVEHTDELVTCCNNNGFSGLFWWWRGYWGWWSQRYQLRRQSLDVPFNRHGYYRVMPTEGQRGIIVFHFQDNLRREIQEQSNEPGNAWAVPAANVNIKQRKRIILEYIRTQTLEDSNMLVPLLAHEAIVSWMNLRSIEKRLDVPQSKIEQAIQVWERDCRIAQNAIDPLRLYELIDILRTKPAP